MTSFDSHARYSNNELLYAKSSFVSVQISILRYSNQLQFFLATLHLYLTITETCVSRKHVLNSSRF